MLNHEIIEKIFTVVEANQPVTALNVSDLLKKEYGLELPLQEVNGYLLKMRTNFPKRIVRSADRFSVVELDV